MSARRKWLLSVVAVALGLGPVAPAGALEWPGWTTARCQACGLPIEGYSVPAPPPSWWPRRFGFAYRKRCCPPCAGYAAPAAPPMVPAAPGMAQPAPAPAQPAPPQPGEPAPQPTAPQPEGTAPTAPTTPAPDYSQGAPASGLGGTLASRAGPALMFGDLLSMGHLSPLALSGSQFRPPPPPEPPPTRGPFSDKSAPLNPVIRSFKMADNQTPFPVNRVSFSFNFYDYVNQSVNSRFNIPISRIRAYQYIWGVEKTFLDGNASFGLRLPLNSINGNSNIAGVGNQSIALGDLAMYFKYAFWMDREAGRVFSGGMALSAPTGPTAFGGAPYLRAVHYVYLQPWIGFQWTWDRAYMIGFSAVDVPLGTRDALLYYNDLAVGYYVFRAEDPDALIQRISPIFETHVNTPLNHRDVFNPRDIGGTADSVNLTEGLSIFFRNRAVLSLGVVEPVTGPRPFSIEALALFNVFF